MNEGSFGTLCLLFAVTSICSLKMKIKLNKIEVAFIVSQHQSSTNGSCYDAHRCQYPKKILQQQNKFVSFKSELHDLLCFQCLFIVYKHCSSCNQVVSGIIAIEVSGYWEIMDETEADTASLDTTASVIPNRLYVREKHF